MLTGETAPVELTAEASLAEDVPSFRFVDLFAGIGGFHAAMKAFGGECVYAVEIDKKAANVYEANWGHPALGDITEDADADRKIMNVPPHDVLCAGFPCQPFSKSGAQRGMDETRGTLFFNIASIITAHHPKVVLLENVRNLVGPRHGHEWDVIIETLRDEGYWVSDQPAIFSPHLLPPRLGGVPQVRERVFIAATWAPDKVKASNGKKRKGPDPVASMTDRFPVAEGSEALFDPKRDWRLEDLLDDSHNVQGCELSDTEVDWIEAWDQFVLQMRPAMHDRHLPGHPIWADAWLDFPEMAALFPKAAGLPQSEEPDGQSADSTKKKPLVPAEVTMPTVDPALPAWKRSHLEKNYDLFQRHFDVIIPWAHRYGVYDFPASRRKLEWQAQETKSLWDTVMHFRPSGIRAKKATYIPALVAITQTSIVGPRERRLSPRETARLQGLPDTFVFPDQTDAWTYKQMGNGVNVSAVWHVFRTHVESSAEELGATPEGRAILAAVKDAPPRPQEILAKHRPARESTG